MAVIKFTRVMLATTVLLLIALLSVACGAAATPTLAGQAVVVELDEWNVRRDKAAVPAGSATFEARNVGTIPHEMVVLKTDLAAESLVVEGSEVNEDASGELIGEVEEDELGPGQSSSTNFNLTAGKYVLFCNIPGHYRSGMFTDFEVR